MKKLLITIIFILTIFVFNYSFAYKTNGYYTEYLYWDVPNGYNVEESSDNSGTKYYTMSKNSNSIIIGIISNPDVEIKYSQNDLDEILDGIKSQSNFDITVLSKEISTICNEQYKCYLIDFYESKYGFYQRQYHIISDHYIYSITLTSSNKSFFTSSDAIKVINSIEIKDTITESETLSSKMLTSFISTTILVIISSIISKFSNKEKKYEHKEIDKENSELLDVLINKLEVENSTNRITESITQNTVVNSSESIINTYMKRSGLSKEVCTYIYNILILAQNGDNYSARKMIHDVLIPQLKSENIVSNVGIAFGMLTNDILLAQDEAEILAKQIMSEMVGLNEDNSEDVKRYCINCGHQLEENANFCNNCGNNIRKEGIEDVL